MELKKLISKYVYRIEPKPGGGFIAHPADPAVPPLEAPTRIELQQKIQETIMAGLSADFPGLKLGTPSTEMAKFSLHVERNASGGFDIHSSDPNTTPVSAATHDEVESHFAEKLIGFMGKHFAPEFAQALAAQGAAGDIKVFVQKTGFTVTTTGHGSSGQPLSAGQTIDGTTGTIDASQPSAPISNAIFSSSNQGGFSSATDGPITPGNERSPFSAIIRFLIALLILLAITYFFLHRH